MSLALAAKNGLFGMCSLALERDLDLADLRHVADEARCRTARCSHLRATAPAPTIGAVSRADDAPAAARVAQAVLAGR